MRPVVWLGSGVFEIALKHDKEAYRCVQAVQLGDKIYVLHAFQKKAKKGIKTPQKDLDLIKQRYKDAKELESNEK
ncbi:Phage protein [hydrothermal vent metagenome]|uniref:Phage protein n=1 Tax=hydrothermal vent metagenome TaxID=652676 RepID=A0A3B1CPG9_9ZZZZ